MASTYLTRTPSSAGNRRTFTISVWVKFLADGNNDAIFNAWSADSNSAHIVFKRRSTDGGQLGWSQWAIDNFTNRIFRDVNAWYHIVYRVDTTQASGGNRIRLYVNGEQETSFAAATDPAQNEELPVNNTVRHIIGANGYSSIGNHIYGNMAHFHLCDGYSYAPSEFGETDSTTGIWKVKTAPSVTYGTNGFFLKFENSAAMGTDSAGSNNFAVNGTMTKLIDTPSNVFATWNLLFPQSQYGTYTNGNTSVIGNNNTYASRTNSTLAASSGKYYMEFKIIDVQGSSYPGVGMISTQNAITEGQVGGAANSVSYRAGGTILTNGSTTATENSYTDNDIIGVAMDLDNGAVYFHKNGTYQNNGNPTSGSSKTGSLYSFTPGTDTYHFGCTLYQADSELSANFGNGYFGTTAVSSAQNPDDGIGIFEYDVPAGYRALCTKSINEQEYS